MENNQNETIKYHYDMLRDNFSAVIKKMDRELAYFRIYFKRRTKTVEVIYDTPTNLLSSAGIVLSKEFRDGKSFFKVKKISYLPTELRKPNRKFYNAECGSRETPKDYPIQIASAINNAFSNIFTIDLVEVVKQTTAIFEIKIKSEVYSLTSGGGMKGEVSLEKITYKDMQSGRKVKRKGVTVSLPDDPAFEKETAEVLDAIERKCKELFFYKESRFEIAQRLLRPKKSNEPKLSRREIRELQKRQQAEETASEG